jgi:PAS domain-containing protein
MLVRGAILRTPDGVVARIAGTQTNLTERKKAEERLRRSHELLSLTGQVAKVGGWRLDLETQDLSCTEEINLLCDVDPAIRLTLAEGLSLFDREVHETLRALLTHLWVTIHAQVF